MKGDLRVIRQSQETEGRSLSQVKNPKLVQVLDAAAQQTKLGLCGAQRHGFRAKSKSKSHTQGAADGLERQPNHRGAVSSSLFFLRKTALSPRTCRVDKSKQKQKRDARLLVVTTADVNITEEAAVHAKGYCPFSRYHPSDPAICPYSRRLGNLSHGNIRRTVTRGW
jgi:hypothetical protein